jgi:type I restriction enzyme R subunit
MLARYGEIEDAAVRKVTGSVDRVSALIRSYRNDALPKLAVTVDLLTTGIDVPSITNLVFVRRVNSRILYEQMLGRATRLCDEIGKETFRIFDAVDLYPHLENLTDMKPVVVDPALSFEQLLQEPTSITDDGHRSAIRDQLAVKWSRKVRRLAEEARRRYRVAAGEEPEATLERIRHGALADLAKWFKDRPTLGPIFDWSPEGNGSFLPISHHPDQLAEVTRGYGAANRPEDFLDNSTSFVRNNVQQDRCARCRGAAPARADAGAIARAAARIGQTGLYRHCFANRLAAIQKRRYRRLDHRLHSPGRHWRSPRAL